MTRFSTIIGQSSGIFKKKSIIGNFSNALRGLVFTVFRDWFSALVNTLYNDITLWWIVLIKDYSNVIIITKLSEYIYTTKTCICITGIDQSIQNVFSLKRQESELTPLLVWLKNHKFARVSGCEFIILRNNASSGFRENFIMRK